MSDNPEELNKISYAGEDNSITQEDITEPITDDAWADPLRTEGASTDPNFNMNYGDLDEKIDKVYETKASHPNFRDIQRFINKQTDENERFSHEVVFNPKSYPVHEGIRKPTELEWTQMDEKDRTKTRRNWFMDNKAAVEKVSSSMGEFIKKGFQKTIKLLSQESVGDYKKLLKTTQEVKPHNELIDFDFIAAKEGGMRTRGYVVRNKVGAVYPESGVTIGVGVDLAHLSKEDLNSAGLDQETIDKLTPALGIKGELASKFTDIKIPESEAEKLTEVVKERELGYMIEEFDKQSGGSFKDMPAKWRTVLGSVFWQFGRQTTGFDFWEYLVNKDYDKALGELRNFGDDFPTRRNSEADYVQGDYRGKNRRT